MKDIILCTLNSTYQHCSFGLRYIFANLEEFQERTEIMEFTVAQNPKDIVQKILDKSPQVVGFGVYIWNTRETQHVIEILKAVSPKTAIVLGGPEVSYEAETQAIVNLADHVIQGEADFLFLEFCQYYFNNQPIPKIINAKLPDIKKIKLPYSLYSDQDIANRIIYVEASRGCPYKCEYCLSSLDKSVRNFELTSLLGELGKLLDRGVRQFKFVDRTFNLSPTISKQILEFFLNRIQLGLFLHFEMVPDRLPDELKDLIERFPKGSLQFEIGIQTFNPVVAKNVSRRQDYEKIKENFKYLKEKTSVHTHADLIFGLPGETLESFGQGFDILADYAPDEIQIGVLKRLKGFPLSRHDNEFKMVYDKQPPFQILQNSVLDYYSIQILSQFAKTWDLISNSGNFPNLMNALFSYAKQYKLSCFDEVLKLSEFLKIRHPQSHGISLLNLLESVWLFFSAHKLSTLHSIEELLALDYAYKKRRDLPLFLKSRLTPEFIKKIKDSNLEQRNIGPKNATPERQQRHFN